MVNGTRYARWVEARTSLADFLRDEIGLSGTHLGCEHGVCGACSVLFDGRSIRACLILAAQAQGHGIVTIEGLSHDPLARRLAEEMSTHHGLQCGFCTPGVMVTAVEYLRSAPKGGEEDVRDALSGNICRCTGYQGIVTSVLAVAEEGGQETALPTSSQGGSLREGSSAQPGVGSEP